MVAWYSTSAAQGGTQSGEGVQDSIGLERGRDRDPQDLAARLRAAAEGIDRDDFADRMAELCESREAEERQRARKVELEKQRELERQKEIEREREVRNAAERDRDDGWGYGR